VPKSSPEVLPGTRPLTLPDDILREQFEEERDFLRRSVGEAVREREQRDACRLDSIGAYRNWREEKLRQLEDILGFELDTTPRNIQRSLLVREQDVAAYRLSWRCGDHLTVEGLLLEPRQREVRAGVVLVPSPEVTLEELCGLAGPRASCPPKGRALAGAGCLVVCPHIIRRDHLGDLPLDDRQRLFRLGFLVGEHLLGAEVQKVLSCVDFVAEHRASRGKHLWVEGAGLGGLVALLAVILDARVPEVWVDSEIGCGRDPTQVPVDRDMWGLDRHAGEADLLTLVMPRRVAVSRSGDSPPPPGPELGREIDRAQATLARLGLKHALELVGFRQARNETFRQARPPAEALDRQCRQARDLEACYRRLIEQAPAIRENRWRPDYSSLEPYEASMVEKREAYLDLIGRLPEPDAPMDPRSVLCWEEPAFAGYRVTVGVYEGVHAHGILLVPKGMGEGERRPAVLCQHGFHGRPEFALGMVDDDEQHYHHFGRRLCERGYVVFAPYVVVPDWEHRNVLVREGRRIGITPVGLEAKKIGRIVDFLQTMSCVDPEHVGFYGLSYGGYTALWVGPVEPRLKVIICSGHFNGWQQKVTHYWPDMTTCYMWHPDEDFYNWNMLNQFGHFDLASLICPRPFFVETGLRDEVTPPEWVQPEWEKVRALYDRLGIPERAEQHVFDGVHEINGQRSFPFLDRWLWNSRGQGTGGRNGKPDGEGGEVDRGEEHAPVVHRPTNRIGGETWPRLQSRTDRPSCSSATASPTVAAGTRPRPTGTGTRASSSR